MGESGVTLSIGDRNISIRVTSVGAWVKRWIHCRGLGMSVSPCIRSEAERSFICGHEEGEYDRDLRDLIRL